MSDLRRFTRLGLVEPEVEEGMLPYSWPKSVVRCTHHKSLLALGVFCLVSWLIIKPVKSGANRVNDVWGCT